MKETNNGNKKLSYASPLATVFLGCCILAMPFITFHFAKRGVSYIESKWEKYWNKEQKDRNEQLKLLRQIIKAPKPLPRAGGTIKVLITTQDGKIISGSSTVDLFGNSSISTINTTNASSTSAPKINENNFPISRNQSTETTHINKGEPSVNVTFKEN